MTVWFVSRHPGAVEWAGQQGLQVDRWVPHLDAAAAETLGEGDVVIGTLPVQLAARVCARGARYLHLSIDLPPGLRGVELDAESLRRLNARLEPFEISPSPAEPR